LSAPSTAIVLLVLGRLVIGSVRHWADAYAALVVTGASPPSPGSLV